MWDEALVFWLRRRGGRRYRRHIVVGRLRFLKRRGVVLLCRLGLMAGLLVWSGWWQWWSLSWALLSLPLADALLSLLPLFWPDVLSYRFTPFAKDNRPVKGRELDIRGKCPLELAGYDISRIPITHILRGQLLGWPPETLRVLVPNA